MKKFFTIRFFSGLIYFLLTIPLLLWFYDSILLNLVMAMISTRICYEIIHVSKAPVTKTFFVFLCGVAALIPISPLFYEKIQNLEFFLFFFFLIAIFWYIINFEEIKLGDFSLIMLFTLVIPIFLTAPSFSSSLKNGQFYLILTFLGTWISDVCAQLSGKTFGKHKLGSTLSPNKTVEGCIGSVLCNATVFLIFGLVINGIFGLDAKLVPLFAIGAFVSVTAQIGDLIASAIKRTYGVKDFSNLIPGHGGMYDRFDSFAIVAPTVYIFAKLFSFLG